MNGYGDPIKWQYYADLVKIGLSILNVTKYPASLAYLLLTLGCVFLFLGYTADRKVEKWVFFSKLADRPLLIYLFSTWLIHLMAIMFLWIVGKDPASMIITSRSYVGESPLASYGYGIGTVYLIWIGVVIACYFLNKFLISFFKNDG